MSDPREEHEDTLDEQDRRAMTFKAWVKIRSWHIVLQDGTTLCGRKTTGPSRETFPFDEPTCETCARLQLRREERSS